MTATRKWLVGMVTALGVLVLSGVAVFLLVPSDEQLAASASSAFAKALGVPVTVAAVRWHLLPTPQLEFENVATLQTAPLRIQRLTAWPNVAALWQRRLQFDRAELQGAVVPQLSLRALGQREKTFDVTTLPGGFTLDRLPLARLEFHALHWVTRRGIDLVYDGEIDFDPAWRPRTAGMRRSDFSPATTLTLTRLGQENRWDTRITMGGGTANGEVQLQTRADGRLNVSGRLQARGVEVSSGLAAFKRRSPIAGKASGETTLRAEGWSLGELARSLNTQTVFAMGPSTVLHFDLDKAIRSAGKKYKGQTPLESITGQLDTQNSADGMTAAFTTVKARSGTLSATGQGRLAERRIDADFAVDLVDGVVGVPLKVTGPLEKVSLSVPPGAIAGALVGSALLPGIGTALGARLGASLGKVFGTGRADKPVPAPTR